jgi:hypothetical protein
MAKQLFKRRRIADLHSGRQAGEEHRDDEAVWGATHAVHARRVSRRVCHNPIDRYLTRAMRRECGAGDGDKVVFMIDNEASFSIFID